MTIQVAGDILTENQIDQLGRLISVYRVFLWKIHCRRYCAMYLNAPILIHKACHLGIKCAAFQEVGDDTAARCILPNHGAEAV